MPYIGEAHKEAMGEWIEAQAKRYEYKSESGDLIVKDEVKNGTE